VTVPGGAEPVEQDAAGPGEPDARVPVAPDTARADAETAAGTNSGSAAEPGRAARGVRLLAGLLVVLLGTAAVLGWQVREQRAVERARGEALQVARSTAVVVLSYDHRRLAEDVAEAEELSTGEFLEQYRAATSGLVDQAEAGQVVVTASVQAASVQDAEADRVEVLLFVDQTTRRQGLEEPRTDQNRVRLTLERVDGRWLLSALDAL
jgi:Mce-associated membrane protein